MAFKKLAINKPKTIGLNTLNRARYKVKSNTLFKLKTIINESASDRRQPLVRVAHHYRLP
ncbi:MAG: hypothetical protein V7K31_20725 [Nostoc sp.]